MHWDTSPVFQLQNGVATAWSNGLIDDGTSTAVITYVTHNGGHQYESRLSYSNVAASPGMGMTFEFQMLETNSNILHYAGAGRAFVALTGDVPATGVGISTKYGHSRIIGSVGASFSGLTIDFKPTVITAGKHYVHIPLNY